MTIQLDESLYARYVRAIEYFNAHIEQRQRGSAKKGLKLRVIPATEFPTWWAEVCSDQALKQRWEARFDDPAAALEAASRRATESLWQFANLPNAA